MRLLDTREQKSPRFLMEAFPDIQIQQLTVGDYFSGKKIEKKFYQMERFGDDTQLQGNLVEIKIGKDFGIHTEQLERFQDELCRMSNYRVNNPYVTLHAVWMIKYDYGMIVGEIRHFNHLCFQYHVWGHIVTCEKDLIELLKDLDQPSSYKEFKPFIKRSHEEPTDLAKQYRQIPKISSEKAIELAKEVKSPILMYEYYHITGELALSKYFIDALLKVFGTKKKGGRLKIVQDIIDYYEEAPIGVETGEEP